MVLGALDRRPAEAARPDPPAAAERMQALSNPPERFLLLWNAMKHNNIKDKPHQSR
jgi:hypothetical protein